MQPGEPSEAVPETSPLTSSAYETNSRTGTRGDRGGDPLKCG